MSTPHSPDRSAGHDREAEHDPKADRAAERDTSAGREANAGQELRDQHAEHGLLARDASRDLLARDAEGDLLARVFLSRVVEPGDATGGRWVRELGAVAVARRLREGTPPLAGMSEKRWAGMCARAARADPGRDLAVAREAGVRSGPAAGGGRGGAHAADLPGDGAYAAAAAVP
ncbi:hypothetical protein ABT317_29845, partial [Streptomyces carpinensis]